MNQTPDDVPLRARVFISCGQQKDSGETNIAMDIRARLQRMGFDPYVALVEQSLSGVKENIFAKLAESEYLVFVDFARERLYQLANGQWLDTGKHRGSLFSNQELAIAAYLGIDCIAFQEQGLQELDGILRFIQANCLPFSSRSDLPSQVEAAIKQRIANGKWDPRWRNELSLHFLEKVTTIAQQTRMPLDWYHLEARNNHRQKMARNCACYISSIKDVKTGSTMSPPQLELTWAGTFSLYKHILPRRSLPLDAFFVRTADDEIVFRAAESSSSQYSMPRIKQPGDYLIQYTVVSDNFPQTTKTFLLQFDGRHSTIGFQSYDREESR